MTDRQELLKTIAAGTAVKQIADEAIAAAKAKLQEELPRGTEYLYDSSDPDTRRELGYATVPKPAQPKPVVSFEDSEVLPWLIETMPDAVEMRPVIQDWAREDLRAAALRLFAAGEELQPGVTVTQAKPKPASARFTPAKDLVPLVRELWQRGELDLAGVLALEPARPEPGAA